MYTVSPQGIIALDGRPLALTDADAALFQAHVVDRWRSLAATYASKYGVPLPWVLAIVWAESGGNPNAINHEPTGATGVGLMQITDPGLKGGRSDAQVADPATNLDIGVKFLSRIMALGNADLPAVASYFNCGGRADGKPHTAPTSGQNPAWGLCATANYLERVSAANNVYLATNAPRAPAAPGWKPVVAAIGAVVAARWFLR